MRSYLGAGLVSFYPGYQFQAEAPHNLWVRGPINRPKDGIAALEQLAVASIVPYIVAVQWQCTQPDQTIRFEAGEAFGTILPYSGSPQESVTLDLAPLDDALDLYDQIVQQLVDSAAMQQVFQHLGTTTVKVSPLLGIVFSRNRAVQLDATLRSFFLHGADADEIPLRNRIRVSWREYSTAPSILNLIAEALATIPNWSISAM